MIKFHSDLISSRLHAVRSFFFLIKSTPVSPWLPPLLLLALRFAGFTDTLAEPSEKVVREHELIYFFLGLSWIIAIVDAVVLEAVGFVDGESRARVVDGAG